MHDSPARRCAIAADCRRATRSMLVGRVFTTLAAEHGTPLLMARPLQAGAISRVIEHLAAAHRPRTKLGAVARYVLAHESGNFNHRIRRKLNRIGEVPQ